MKTIHNQKKETTTPGTFDAETNIYTGSRYQGFGYVIPPVSGSGEDVRPALRHLFQMEHAPDSVMQVINIASSNITEALDAWAQLPDDANPLYIEQRKKRVEHMLEQGLKDYNILITYSSPTKNQASYNNEIERLSNIRKHMESIFSRVGIKAVTLTPAIQQSLFPSSLNERSNACLSFRSPNNFKKVPETPNLSNLKCDYFYTQTFSFGDPDKEHEKVLRKYYQCSALPFLPSIIGRKEDWEHLKEGAMDGNSILGLSTQITLIGVESEDQIKQAKIEMSLAGYKHNRTSEQVDAPLPLPLPNGQHTKPFDYILSSQASFVAHISGDSKGTGLSGVLYKTRNNQIAFFNNYESYSNYNIAIAASAGSGLGFQLKEFLISQAASGSRCFIVDPYWSMKGTTNLLQGYYHVVTKDNGINPFSTIASDADPDSIDDSLGQISLFVMFLADIDDSHFMVEAHQSVHTVWKEKGSAAHLKHVVSHLSQGDEKAQLLAKRLSDYGYGGRYANLFSFDAAALSDKTNITFNIENFRNNKVLFHANLLSIVLFYMSSLDAGDLFQRKVFLFSDAWQYFDLSKPGAALIEGFYRRIRLYGGSAVMTTSRISDYFSSPVAKIIYDHSHWKMIFRQRPGELSSLPIQQGLNVDAQFLSKLNDLHVVPGKYSEVAIIGGAVSDIYRLTVDSFTQKLYSEFYKDAYEDAAND